MAEVITTALSLVSHRQMLFALHESKMNQISLQSGKIATVLHPAILENLKTLDFENAPAARVTNIGIEAAALVQIDEVPVDGTPEKLSHDASIRKAEDAIPLLEADAPQGYKKCCLFPAASYRLSVPAQRAGTESAFRKRLLQPFLESPAFPPGKCPVFIRACDCACALENQIGPMFPDRREAVSSGHF